MMLLSVSAHGATGMIAVGVNEPGALLPSDVRVLDNEVAELVAEGLGHRLDSCAACGHHPLEVDLDALVAHAEHILRDGRA